MPTEFKKVRMPTWKEMTIGGLAVQPGNSIEYDTGSWSSQVLVFHEGICIHCMQCWIVCPDSTILAKDGKIVGIDLGHCKDCGLCVEACPTNPNSLEFVDAADALVGSTDPVETLKLHVNNQHAIKEPVKKEKPAKAAKVVKAEAPANGGSSPAA